VNAVEPVGAVVIVGFALVDEVEEVGEPLVFEFLGINGGGAGGARREGARAFVAAHGGH